MRFSRWLILGGLAALASAGVAACGDDTPGDGVAGEQGGAGDGSSAAASLSKTIGADGGSLEIDGALLTFPPGALSEDTEITAEVLSADDAAALVALPGGASFRSTPVAFTPHGTTFAKPVTVELTHTGSTGTGLAVGRLANEGDMGWAGVSGPEFVDGKATFTIGGFSIYAVTEDPDGWLDAKNYYETSTFEGFVRVDAGDATTVVEAYPEQGGLPFCIQATVPATAVVAPRIRFTLNEPLPGGAPEDFVTDPAGSMWIAITDNATAGPMNAFLETADGQLWCTPVYGGVTGGVPYGMFTTDCTTNGAPYIPADSPLEVVGVELGVTGMDFTYDICITDVVEVAQ